MKTTTQQSIVFRYVKYETQKGKYGNQVYEFNTSTLKESKIKSEFYPDEEESLDYITNVME